MADRSDIVIQDEPDIIPEDVWDFYVGNNICEQRYGKRRGTSVLAKSDVIITARDGGKLVGLARAITDGLDASIQELSVALSHQGIRLTRAGSSSGT